MFSNIKEKWDIDVNWATVVVWSFFTVATFYGFNFGLPLWGRILVAIYVSTGILVVLTPKARERLSTTPVIIAFAILGAGPIIFAIANPLHYWETPLLIFGMITSFFGICLMSEKVPKWFN